jgi:excinuclease UvrABC nuclease subunit
MVERISGRANDSSWLPASRVSGCYAFYRDGRCLYVGRAKSLRARISSHLSWNVTQSSSWVARYLESEGHSADWFYSLSREDLRSLYQCDHPGHWPASAYKAEPLISWREHSLSLWAADYADATALEMSLIKQLQPVFNGHTYQAQHR